MSKYTHRITVPFTSSVEVTVETDEPIEDDEHAYEMAREEIDRADTSFILTNKEDRDTVELGDELEYAKDLTTGNVCHAVCSEVDWETEENK